MPLQIDGKNVGEIRLAQIDGTLAVMGETCVWDSGEWRTIYTSVRPLHFEVLEITTAGTHTITIPDWCTHVAAILVGGGGGGGKWRANSTTGQGGNRGEGRVLDLAVTPGTLTLALTVGAGGGAGASNYPGGTGGSTTLLGASAPGGSGGSSSGSPLAGQEDTLPIDPKVVPLTDGQTQFFIGPSGKTYGEAGQRGGGGSGGNSELTKPSAPGGDGWARIWMWNRDPRT
ncbi:hypothetical protein EAH68_12865 [Corynebacterium hylobatis]|uniref:Glycine-rich domain-containing protein n=1 Tax=Corynebacterium hylobatis TaxID=1859290 RepID=A0A3S0B341_9CORY|nr:hypothetical protein [Corynebacterium hylobatis]RSZ61547.1 hypothetical protein EAH68_12865 [Corynebacterium hylobatis]